MVEDSNMLKVTIAFAFFFVCLGSSNATNQSTPMERGEQTPSPSQKFPFEVEIQMNGMHICSGAILGQFDVITAAHCIQGLPEIEITVLDSRRRSYQVVMLQLHPLFNATTMDYDVALLKVKSPFELGNYLDKVDIALPGEELLAGNSVEVGGWTRRKGSEDYSFNSVSVTVVPRDECNHTSGGEYPVSDRIICTVSQPTSRSSAACLTDPGAPLVVGDKLFGIASRASACTPGSPNRVLYTEVSKMEYFLRRNTFIHERSKAEVCSELKRISLLPGIASMPLWVPPALNLLPKYFC